VRLEKAAYYFVILHQNNKIKELYAYIGGIIKANEARIGLCASLAQGVAIGLGYIRLSAFIPSFNFSLGHPKRCCKNCKILI